jgi:hypothetical protein
VARTAARSADRSSGSGRRPPAPGPITTSLSARPTSRGSWSTGTTVLPASRRSSSDRQRVDLARWSPRLGSSSRTVSPVSSVPSSDASDPLRLAGGERARQPVEMRWARPTRRRNPSRRSASSRDRATAAGTPSGIDTPVEQALDASAGERWRSCRLIDRSPSHEGARRGTRVAAGRRRTPGRARGRCLDRRVPAPRSGRCPPVARARRIVRRPGTSRSSSPVRTSARAASLMASQGVVSGSKPCRAASAWSIQ